VLAIALVTSGAIGNLIDRLRSSQGVVDFIDVGIGERRWPTFNVADMAVSSGAFLLAWVLWREEREAEEAEKRATALREAQGTAADPIPTTSAEPRDVA
jgi:signal peptidase II